MQLRNPILTRRIFFLVLAALFAVTSPRPADAQGRVPVFIRDAEIEAIIGEFTAPLFTAAGLDPSAVRVYIVKDDTINAFVSGGQNIFVFTGLLLRTERPAQLIGVIAHETGLSFLDATHQSARGMLEFFNILGKQEALLIGQQDPYLRTHPLTQSRVDAVKNHI